MRVVARLACVVDHLEAGWVDVSVGNFAGMAVCETPRMIDNHSATRQMHMATKMAMSTHNHIRNWLSSSSSIRLLFGENGPVGRGFGPRDSGGWHVVFGMGEESVASKLEVGEGEAAGSGVLHGS